jgi:hypothetical protein
MRHLAGWWKRVVVIVSVVAAWTVVASAPAWADNPTKQLNHVLDNARDWLVGIAGALVVVMLTVAGIRYSLAGGDPAQSEQAKTALKAALLGLAIVVLAPVLVAIMRGILGS